MQVKIQKTNSKIMNIQKANQRIQPNLQNLPIEEYYNNLPDVRRVPRGSFTPKLLFLNAISQRVGKPVCSVRRWVYRTANPTKLEKEEIARILKCNVNQLFPEA